MTAKRARYPAGGLEVQQCQPLPQRDMIARLECELPRFAVTRDFDIRRLIGAIGHGLMQ